MASPLAAVREMEVMEVLEVVDVRPGIMENAAPLSARKRTPVEWSWRKTNSPGQMALTLQRDTSFPAMSSCRCS